MNLLDITKQYPLKRTFTGPVVMGLLLMVLSVPHLFGDDSTAAAFLKITPSVRMAALGGNQTAARGHFSDLYANPAGISTLAIPELWITHHDSFLKSNYETVGMGYPTKNQVWGLSAQYIHEGPEERVGVDPATDSPIYDMGQFRWTTTLLQTTWAKRCNRLLSLGASLKGWREDMAITSSSGWAADLGMQVSSILRHLDVGAAVKNAGPKIHGHDLPTQFSIGAAYHLKPKGFFNRTTLFSELDFASQRDTGLRAGLEFYHNQLWLRGGYENVTSNELNGLTQFSFGAGFLIKGWKVDYAWVPKGDLGDEHRVALTIGLGMSPEEREREARKLDSAMEKRVFLRTERYIGEGKKAMEAGNFSSAVERFAQALAWQPENKKASQELKEAQKQLQKKKAEDFYRKGQQYLKQKQWLEAAFSFQQTLTHHPEHKEARRDLVKAQEKILRLKPAGDKNPGYFERGVHHYLNGEHDKALRAWEKELEQNPTHPHLREYMEKAKNRELQMTVATFQDSFGFPDPAVENLAQQAYTLYRFGHIDSAIKTWKRILALDPENKEALKALKDAQARKELGPDVVTTPVPITQVQVLNSRAFEAYHAGDLEKAVSIWKKALQLEPYNLLIKRNLKRAAMELAVREIQ